MQNKTSLWKFPQAGFASIDRFASGENPGSARWQSEPVGWFRIHYLRVGGPNGHLVSLSGENPGSARWQSEPVGWFRIHYRRVGGPNGHLVSLSGENVD